MQMSLAKLFNNCRLKKMNSDRSSGQKANGSANVELDKALTYLIL